MPFETRLLCLVRIAAGPVVCLVLSAALLVARPVHAGELTPAQKACLSGSFVKLPGDKHLDCVIDMLAEANALRAAGKLRLAVVLYEAVATRSGLQPFGKSRKMRTAIQLWRRIVDAEGGRCAANAASARARGQLLCAARSAMEDGDRAAIEAHCLWLSAKVECTKPDARPTQATGLPLAATAATAVAMPAGVTSVVVALPPSCWQTVGCGRHMGGGLIAGAVAVVAGGVLNGLALVEAADHPDRVSRAPVSTYMRGATAGYGLAVAGALYAAAWWLWGAPDESATATRPTPAFGTAGRLAVATGERP